jgi:hypothetical protein
MHGNGRLTPSTRLLLSNVHQDAGARQKLAKPGAHDRDKGAHIEKPDGNQGPAT